MADVTDFLAMNPEDIADTITLPEGSYDLVITSYRTDRVGENQNQIVRLNCKAQAVLESDITDADLENCDGTRLEFWATKKALRQGNPVISLKAFLTKTLGMSGNSLGKCLSRLSVNRLVVSLSTKWLGAIKIYCKLQYLGYWLRINISWVSML